MRSIYIILLLVMMAMTACEKKAQLPYNKYAEKDTTTQTLAKTNAMLNDMEENDINNYVKNSGKAFKVTGIGVRVSVEPGVKKGDSVRTGDLVCIRYKIKNLDGKVIYDHTQKMSVIYVGKERRQTGFAEGLTHMTAGGKAEIVVPSILAYGALGDGGKIEPHQSLVYDVEEIIIKD